MLGKDKPFVMYRRGPLDFTLVPRGSKGWVQFGIWIALLVPLVMWFSGYFDTHHEGSDFSAALFLFGFGLLAWGVGGLWWMCTHCEVIDVSVMLRDKQRERQRAKRNGQCGKEPASSEGVDPPRA